MTFALVGLVVLGAAFGAFCDWRLSLEECRTSWWLLMSWGGYFLAATCLLFIGARAAWLMKSARSSA